MGFVITLASAYRLARFNIDENQVSSFIGLPTPANTIMIASLFWISRANPDSWVAAVIGNHYVLMGIALLLSWLLVADIRLIALKFKTYGIKENLFRYLLILSTVILLIFFQHMAIPFIILLYICLSIIENVRSTR